MDTTLVVPGLNGSGVDHWQTWLERQIPYAVRVVQRDWNEPDLAQWSARLRREIDRAPGRIWIVGHSFGCLAAVQATFDYRERIAGLMLVAPADPEKFFVRNVITESPLEVPTVVVASTNDPWMSFRNATSWADAWGADVINVGAAGHINVRAGFGPWPRGLDIYRTLRRATSYVAADRSSEELFLQLGEI
jgi:predicted alpha/beta hydrolase family esterase